LAPFFIWRFYGYSQETTPNEEKAKAQDEILMPAVSEKQRRFMGAELARKRAGKKTRTGMTTQQLREFASSVKGSGTFTIKEMNRGYRRIG